MSETTERLPQRFRYRHAMEPWRFGACFPVGDGSITWWYIRTMPMGHASFAEDPWEVLGHVIGDVAEFDWIDNDYWWRGKIT